MKKTLLIVALTASVLSNAYASRADEIGYDDMLALSIASPQKVAHESTLRALANSYGIPVDRRHIYEEEEEAKAVPVEKLPSYLTKTLKLEANAEGAMVEEIFVPLTVETQTMTRQCITTADTLKYRISKGELVEGLDYKLKVLVNGVEIQSSSQPSAQELKKIAEDRLIAKVSRYETKELESVLLENGLRREKMFYPINDKTKAMCRQFSTTIPYLLRLIEEGRLVEGRDYLIRVSEK